MSFRLGDEKVAETMLQELFFFSQFNPAADQRCILIDGGESAVADPEYSFRDADRAILRIFTYLKDQKESKGTLPAEAESVIQILEGFLTSRERETAQTAILNPKTKCTPSPFEFEIPAEELDPRKLFRGDK